MATVDHLLSLCLCVVFCLGCYGVKQDFTHQRLQKKLMLGYLRSADPGPSNITVKVGVAIITLKLDEISGELTSKVWQRLAWTDDRLSWNPRDFGGVTVIRIPSEDLWIPDITLYNSATSNVDLLPTNVVVSSDGSVLWIPPSTYQTQCTESEKGQWSCPFKFGSWTYDGLLMPLAKYENALDFSDYVLNSQFEIVTSDSRIDILYYPCCEEPYPALTISLTLKKKCPLDE